MESASIVQKGKYVKVEYTGTLRDGSEFDSSKGREPLEFQAGSKQVIAGFDDAVEGMKMGESKKFTINADQAYGQPQADLLKEIPREALPKDQEPQAGMHLMMKTPDGQQFPAKIASVTEQAVTIDLNHPLAGQDLTFEIKIVGISDKATESKSCGDEGCGNCDDDKEGSCCGSGNCGSC